MKLICYATLVIAFICVFSFAALPQRQASVARASVDRTVTVTGGDALNADFVAIARFGEVPFTVQFKDASTGDPTSWQWNFGDGSTDSIKNPLHTYQTSGSFTVKLTVSDGAEVSNVTRTGFIHTVSQGNCDTTAYPLPGEYTYYIIFSNGSGYVSGNNSYGDLAKASYFDEGNEGYLFGGIFDFAVADMSMISNTEVKFHTWAADGPQGSPGTVLSTQSMLMAEIRQNVDWERSTLVFFDEPLALDGPFFLGVELPQNTGDTLVLFTNEDGQGNPANGWEQHNTNQWYPYTDAQQSWGLNIDHAIFPVVCNTTGISNPLLKNKILVYPNPASETIYVSNPDGSLKNISVSVTDLMGRQVIAPKAVSSGNLEIGLGSLTEGIYLVTVFTDEGMRVEKIQIAR
ncbi:MAG: PKD domain-containing protein [Bacteroidota bacterium]